MDGTGGLCRSPLSGGSAAAAAARVPVRSGGGMYSAARRAGQRFVSAGVRKLTALAGLREETLTVFMKVLGMSYTAELTAQTCSDLGENSLALKVQLLGKLSVFTLTAPLLLELLTLILELAP